MYELGKNSNLPFLKTSGLLASAKILYDFILNVCDIAKQLAVTHSLLSRPLTTKLHIPHQLMSVTARALATRLKIMCALQSLSDWPWTTKKHHQTINELRNAVRNTWNVWFMDAATDHCWKPLCFSLLTSQPKGVNTERAGLTMPAVNGSACAALSALQLDGLIKAFAGWYFKQ